MIRDAIAQARRMHRKAIEATYDGICSIYRMKPVKDPVTKATRQGEVLVYGDIPCHLSYSGTTPAAGGSTVTTVAQTIKLFLAPETEIVPGSRIKITQQGRTENYAKSGKAAVYSSHQEILLDLWKGYA